ncbi:hypothetical protein V22_21530 [Calycomorphotria hydatis]|uniref:Uncharacterized protein n=1 Tax=Calycomorphotria hydatis TaxID=2528027 RepID=A0A517T974_9PLAN|nr:hypothetical protein V22_21530 [Calycomorphotria hydatis]
MPQAEESNTFCGIAHRSQVYGCKRAVKSEIEPDWSVRYSAKRRRILRWQAVQPPPALQLRVTSRTSSHPDSMTVRISPSVTRKQWQRYRQWDPGCAEVAATGAAGGVMAGKVLKEQIGAGNASHVRLSLNSPKSTRFHRHVNIIPTAPINSSRRRSGQPEISLLLLFHANLLSRISY